MRTRRAVRNARRRNFILERTRPPIGIALHGSHIYHRDPALASKRLDYVDLRVARVLRDDEFDAFRTKENAIRIEADEALSSRNRAKWRGVDASAATPDEIRRLVGVEFIAVTLAHARCDLRLGYAHGRRIDRQEGVDSLLELRLHALRVVLDLIGDDAPNCLGGSAPWREHPNCRSLEREVVVERLVVVCRPHPPASTLSASSGGDQPRPARHGQQHVKRNLDIAESRQIVDCQSERVAKPVEARSVAVLIKDA